MHPLCSDFYEKIRLLAQNGALKDLFIESQQAAKRKDELVKQYAKSNVEWDYLTRNREAERVCGGGPFV